MATSTAGPARDREQTRVDQLLRKTKRDENGADERGKRIALTDRTNAAAELAVRTF